MFDDQIWEECSDGRHVVLITCMDKRMNGLRSFRGSSCYVIRNAGPRFGSDVERSLDILFSSGARVLVVWITHDSVCKCSFHELEVKTNEEPESSEVEAYTKRTRLDNIKALASRFSDQIENGQFEIMPAHAICDGRGGVERVEQCRSERPVV